MLRVALRAEASLSRQTPAAGPAHPRPYVSYMFLGQRIDLCSETLCLHAILLVRCEGRSVRGVKKSLKPTSLSFRFEVEFFLALISAI
ncbi:hypothetical protein Rxyl_1911 [Rubrobacter xylanophilus DSM 9941]|uniref:Uncharacterized protein n=1 Tax=Rubrobacter xylanophilus (strain DSM 9941 / JCM 11954 / NBRC 16129 / PRD-1) TaxID=266117 RepID=Q1AUS0_RUBXD|nr:hypothetical protein Rxyl_1911 [Rubrobacter xylanophilus DSM 9941]